MGFFTSGTFWFIEGLLVAVMAIGLKVWMEDRKVEMLWWKWVIAALFVLFVGFTIAFVTTSLGEFEPTAALLGGIIFGVGCSVFAIILWRLLHWVPGKKNKLSEKAD